MWLYALISIALALAYCFILYSYLKYWRALGEYLPAPSALPTTSVTVLIPARNEADNIQECLASIFKQDFPADLLEVIVIDDHSEDQTAALARAAGARVLSLAEFINSQQEQSFKKLAIEIGIQHASGKLIVTTDADCIVPKQWLHLIVTFYQEKRARFIAAPVNFHNESNALERFQSLDFMGMMLITGAGIHSQFMRMCNGANLAYPKAIFEKVNGFEGVDHLASGDDMFLMQKVAKRYPNDVYFLKNSAATVKTKAKPDWNSFLQQRIRWGTKSSSYQEIQVTAVLALVFFLCCNLFLSLLLTLIWDVRIFGLFLFQLSLKIVADFFLLRTAARYFGRTDLMHSFWSAQWYHILYIVVVGTLSNLRKTYIWKGRRVR